MFLGQCVVVFVGSICEANNAYSRANIAQKLGDAVKRRSELETLKSRQDQLLLSVIPAYLTDKVREAFCKHTSSFCLRSANQSSQRRRRAASALESIKSFFTISTFKCTIM